MEGLANIVLALLFFSKYPPGSI